MAQAQLQIHINNASRRSRADHICQISECISCALIKVRILLSDRTKRLPRNMIPKPYPCPNCIRSYSKKSTLNRHLREECGKEPQYLCFYCERTRHNKAFHQQSNYKRHLRTVHKYIMWFRYFDNWFSDWFDRLAAQLCDRSILIFKRNELSLLNFLSLNMKF